MLIRESGRRPSFEGLLSKALFRGKFRKNLDSGPNTR